MHSIWEQQEYCFQNEERSSPLLYHQASENDHVDGKMVGRGHPLGPAEQRRYLSADYSQMPKSIS